MASLGIINLVKYNRFLYFLYYYIGNSFIQIIRLFIRTNPHLIIINSFGGRKYDDSPKEIYLKMIGDPRFHNYDFVWCFIDPERYIIPRGRKIKSDTFQYYITLLKARCWITNSGLERGLSFRGKKTFYLNTWHGTPIKLMGSDISLENTSFKTKKKKSNIDVFLAQGQYDVDIFSKAFAIPKESFAVIGLPRNDNLVYQDDNYRLSLLRRLNIPEGKKVILYAPTFREYIKDPQSNVQFRCPISSDLFSRSLGDSCVLLIRAHYEVVKLFGFEENDSFVNVSDYDSLNDLMIASDLLVSDYSSIFFDYSILNKPMLCYAYDYEEYANKRGLYFDIRDVLPTSDNESDLYEMILRAIHHPNPYIEQTVQFRNSFVSSYGNATSQAIDIIADNICEYEKSNNLRNI